jgi:hypothetical protein
MARTLARVQTMVAAVALLELPTQRSVREPPMPQRMERLLKRCGEPPGHGLCSVSRAMAVLGFGGYGHRIAARAERALGGKGERLQ